MFVLLLSEQDLVLKKSDDKENPMEISNLRYDKLVFALQDKIITVYMGLIPIYI